MENGTATNEEVMTIDKQSGTFRPVYCTAEQTHSDKWSSFSGGKNMFNPVSFFRLPIS
jgi:hypothetical protein